MEEREQLEAARILTAALAERDMRLGELADTTYLVPLFGKMTDENYRRLEEATKEAPLLLEPLLSRQGSTWFLGLTAPGYREGAGKLLDSLYFKGFSLKTMVESLPGDPAEPLSRRIENHRKAIEGLRKAAGTVLGERRENMEQLYASVYTMQRVYDLCRGRGSCPASTCFPAGYRRTPLAGSGGSSKRRPRRRRSTWKRSGRYPTPESVSRPSCRTSPW